MKRRLRNEIRFTNDASRAHAGGSVLQQKHEGLPRHEGQALSVTHFRRMITSRLGYGRLQDVRSLRPLCALHDLELNVFSLFQGLESFSLQRRVMYEDIVPTLKANEPKPLPIVKPLDRTFCFHKNTPFLNGHT